MKRIQERELWPIQLFASTMTSFSICRVKHVPNQINSSILAAKPPFPRLGTLLEDGDCMSELSDTPQNGPGSVKS